MCNELHNNHINEKSNNQAPIPVKKMHKDNTKNQQSFQCT